METGIKYKKNNRTEARVDTCGGAFLSNRYNFKALHYLASKYVITAPIFEVKQRRVCVDAITLINHVKLSTVAKSKELMVTLKSWYASVRVVKYRGENVIITK